MKKLFKSLMTVACCTAVLGLASCNKDEKPLKPAVTLTAGTATETTLTFTLEAQNATEAAYLVLDAEAAAPAPETVFTDGTAADASKAGEYTVSGLKMGTAYQIAAAAKNANGIFSEVTILTASTLADPYDFQLEVSLGEITHATIGVTIKASDELACYLARCMPAAELEGLSDDEVHAKFLDAFKKEAENYGVSLTEYLTQVLNVGSIENGGFRGLSPETEYTVVVFGMSEEDGSRTSQMHRLNAKTTAIEMSDITFDIQVPEDKITATTVSITITPSNLEEKFVWLCQPVSTNPDKSAREIAEAYVKQYGGWLNMGMGLYSGVQNYPEYEVASDTEYYIVVWAYNQGITSEPVMVTFKTLAGADIETLDCEFEVTKLTAHKAIINVTPNDNTIPYIAAAAETEGFDADAVKADIEAQIQEFYEIQHQFNPSYTIEMAVDYLTHRGPAVGLTIQGLKEQTAYTVFAVAINKEGKASKNIVTEDLFTTPEFKISDATVTSAYHKTFSGDDAQEAGLFPEVDKTGRAIVTFTYEASEDAVAKYQLLLNGDLTDPEVNTDEALWDYSGWKEIEDFEKDPHGYFLVDWGVEYTVLTMAKDAEGIFGPVHRVKFTPTKDNISPISELEDMLNNGSSSAATRAAEAPKADVRQLNGICRIAR